MEFTDRRANGETAARQNVKARGRLWMETQLGADWSTSLGNGTVLARKKVCLSDPERLKGYRIKCILRTVRIPISYSIYKRILFLELGHN